jgi:cytoskeletal protein CcmA (bactofilin family)
MFNIYASLHKYINTLEEVSNWWFNNHPYNIYKFNTISIIPKGSVCTGNLTVFEPCYTLDIEGTINGDVSRIRSVDTEVYKHSIINISGRVNGTIIGFDTVIVNGGTVEGVIETEYCQISNNGRVSGNIKSKEIDIDSYSHYEEK